MVFVDNQIVPNILIIIVLAIFLAARYLGKKPIAATDILISRFFLAVSVVIALNLICYFIFQNYLFPVTIDLGIYLGLSGFAILWLASITIKEDMITGRPESLSNEKKESKTKDQFDHVGRVKLNVGELLNFKGGAIKLDDIGMEEGTSRRRPIAFSLIKNDAAVEQIKAYVGDVIKINDRLSVQVLDVMAGFTLNAKWVEVEVLSKK